MAFKDQSYLSSIKTAHGLIKQKIPQQTLDLELFLSGFGELQKKYILDRERYLDIEGGKRGGKSVSIAGRIVYTDLYVMPQKFGYIVYAATTAGQAKRLGSKRILRAKNHFNLNWKERLSDNIILTYNKDHSQRNEIVFLGLKDMKSAEKYQGLPIKAVVVDEAPLINSEILEVFIRDVVALGMRDFGSFGSCTLIGNPAPVEVGYRWDYQKRPSTKKYRMNIVDNPSFDLNETNAFIDEELKHRGETRENMSNASKRLILGEKAYDTELTVLKFKPSDFYETLPKPLDQYFTACGIDHGFNDKTAFAVLAFDKTTNEVFLEYEYQEAALTTTPIAEKLKEISANYKTSPHNIYDTSGAGKTTAETIRIEHGIPIEAAKKQEKLAWINRLRDYNKRGLLKIKQSSSLLPEANLIIFLKDFSKLDEKAYHSDIFHAVLYAFRFIYSYHYSNTSNPDDLTPLTPREKLLQKIKQQEKNLNHETIDISDYKID